MSWKSPEDSSTHTSPRFAQVTFLLWSAAWGSVSFQKHHQLRHCPIFSTKSKAGSLSRNERREEPETSSQRSIYPYTTLERLKNCLPHPAPLLSCRMPNQMCPCKSSIRWHPPGKTSKCQAKESRYWGSTTGRLTKTRKQVLDISGKILILSYSTSAVLWQGEGCRTRRDGKETIRPFIKWIPGLNSVLNSWKRRNLEEMVWQAQKASSALLS